MAEFTTDELIDCIRHNIALLNDSGFDNRVLLSPRRHAVPGGLPLEMCKGEDEAGPSSLHYELQKQFKQQKHSSTKNDSQQMYQQIRKNLLTQLNGIERSGRLFNKTALPFHQRPTECTLKFEPKNPEELFDVQKPLSLTSRLISQAKFPEGAVDNSTCSLSFAEYAKFEAMECTFSSKKFNILFPAVYFGEKGHVLTIYILNTATIDDLIGLACHVYSRKSLNPPCESPSLYDLYLAEEDLSDFDTDLPPQDRRRRVADCGFPYLAIVKRSLIRRRSSQLSRKQTVRIYLVDGRCYTMDEVEGISLRQVFEYALSRKNEAEQTNSTEANHQLHEFFRHVEYQLEPIDYPGVALELDQSVSSAGTLDFLLIRKNSSRGDFDISLTTRKTSDLLPLLHKQSKSMDFSKMLGVDDLQNTSVKEDSKIFSTSINELVLQNPLQTFPLETSFSTCQNSSTDDLITNQLTAILHGGSILNKYSVSKINRIKPKTCLKLVIRENCLELIQRGKVRKADSDRKIKRIPWKLIASVEVSPNSEKRVNALRLVRITFLSCVSSTLMQHILESEKTEKLTQGTLIYEGSCWKILIIEAAAHEAWQIANN
uniref:Sin1 middle CRIM domain-containing protein n=1 Tax=Meloidogyne incognita TaxID=6306 RepID=A0A914LIR1_MELIC